MKNRLNRSILAVVLIISLLFQQVSASAQGGNNTSSPQTGHSSAYDYLQYDAGSAGTLYVNQYTTKPHVRRSDLTLGGNRMPVEIEFWYDEENLSNDLTASANPYGYGWMTSYNQLLEYYSADDQYAYRDANGTWIYFEDSGEVTEDNARIWTETASAEESLAGAELYLEEDALYTDYTAVTIRQNDHSSTFDASGRLLSVSDDYGNTLAITYTNQTGPAISMITDGVGRRYVFSYSNGWLSRIACQDGSGNPIMVENTEIAVTYTIASGCLIRTSLWGEYSYDSSRRITALWGIGGIGYSLSYNGNTQEVTSVTKQASMDISVPISGTVTTISKSNNQVTITEGSLEQVQTYDSYGRPVNCEINELVTEGGITAPQLMYGIDYIYEEVLQQDGSYISQLTDIQFYDGTEQSGQSNRLLQGSTAEGEPAADPETGGDPEDPETEQEDYGTFTEVRDQYGNVISETNTVGGLSQTTLYTYSSDGNYLASVTNEDGIVQAYSFNSLSGILESVTDGLNNTTSYSYNALRELTAASLPVSDLAGDAAGMSAAYTYSGGRVSSVNYGGFSYTFTYDAWGNITQVLMGSSPLISYSYGAAADKGQVQSLTYGNGQQVFYGYNSKDQIISVGYTGQLNRFSYTYDEEGKLASISDNVTEQTTTYTEDGLELRDSENNLLYSMEAGETDGTILKSIFGTSWSSTESSTTDETNGGTATTYSINRGNDQRLYSIAIYDALGRMQSVSSTRSSLTVTESKNYQNGNNQTGNLVSRYTAVAENSYDEISLTGQYNYTYDANGNITQEVSSFQLRSYTPFDPYPTENLNPGNDPTGFVGPVNPILDDPQIYDLSGTRTYDYDEAGQLTSALHSGKASYSYEYDSSGNLVSSETSRNISLSNTPAWETTSKTFEYNTKGQLTGYETAVSMQTTYTDYTLDAMGNPTSITTSTDYPLDTPVTKTLTWGEGRMLTGITTDANNYVYYTYNADGLRIKKTVCKNGLETETDYIWSDGKLVAERTELSSTIILYDSDNSPVGFIRQGIAGTNTVQYSYLKNLQGDITHILDEDGETVVSYTYDPWGNPTVQGNTSIAAINPCSYRGYYYDEETGWYYLQSRYYDPEIGRFLNADEILLIGSTNELNGFNPFIYCNNQPIIAHDENGAATINIVFAAVGSVVGWFLGDYVAKQLGYYSGLKYWAIRTGIIVGGAVIGWFAGTLLTRILANFLRSRPDIVFKLVAAKGGATVYTVLQFLGINPFTLYQNGSTFIGLLKAFNASKVTLTYDWAIKLYYKAKQLGYGIELDSPHGGYTWHIHILKNGKRISGLHIQILKTAWDYLKRINNN